MGVHLHGENASERFPATQDTRFDSAERNLKDVGNFLVTEIFKVAEDDSGAEIGVDFAQGGFDELVSLFVKGKLVGIASRIGDGVEPRAGSLILVVEAHFLPPVPAEPSPLIIGFVDSDSVNPGFQRALSSKAIDRAENFQEHFLDNIGGIRRIVDQPVAEVIDCLLYTSPSPRD